MEEIELDMRLIEADLNGYEKFTFAKITAIVKRYDELINLLKTKKNYENTKTGDRLLNRFIKRNFDELCEKNDDPLAPSDVNTAIIKALREAIKPVDDFRDELLIKRSEEYKKEAREWASVQITCSVCDAVFRQCNKVKHEYTAKHIKALKVFKSMEELFKHNHALLDEPSD